MVFVGQESKQEWVCVYVWLYSRNQHNIASQLGSRRKHSEPLFPSLPQCWTPCFLLPTFPAQWAALRFGERFSFPQTAPPLLTLTVMEEALVTFWKPDRKGTGVEGVFILNLLGVCFHLPCLINPGQVDTRTAWRREWLPTPVLSPGEFHGQRSLAATARGVAVGHDWATNTILV